MNCSLKSLYSTVKSKGLLSELLKGGASSLILKFFGLGISYLLVWYITSRFGAEIYGDYIFFISVITVLSILLTFGVDIYALRFSTDFIIKKKWKEAASLTVVSYRSVFILWLITAVLLLSASGQIASWLSLSEIVIYAIIFTVLPFSLLKLTYQFFRSKKWITIYSAFQSVLIPGLTIVIILVLLSTPLDSVPEELTPLAAYSISVLLLVIVGAGIWLKFVFKKTAPTDVLTTIKKSERFRFRRVITGAFPFLMASSIILIGSQIDQIFIKVIDSSESLGMYMVAFKIAMVISFPLIAINSISAPKFSEYFGVGDMKNLRTTSHYTSNLCMLISLFPFLIVMIFPAQLLSIFGEEFTAAKDVLRLLAVGQYITSSFGSIGVLLQMTDNQKILFKVSAGTIVLHVILLLILLPLLGIFGAAIASVSALILRNVLLSVFAKIKLGFKPINIL